MIAYCTSNECAGRAEELEQAREVRKWEIRLATKACADDWQGLRDELSRLIELGINHPDDREMVKKVFQIVQERYPAIIRNELNLRLEASREMRKLSVSGSLCQR